MPYDSLRDFIARLEREGRLVRVSHPVSPALEMTEIQTRVIAEGGPAMLFKNVVQMQKKVLVCVIQEEVTMTIWSLCPMSFRLAARRSVLPIT